MILRKWQLGAVAGGLAAAIALAAAAQNRKEVLERRQALIERLNKTVGKDLSVAPSEGLFLKILAESTAAKRALEIGSSIGYSAIWIGSGLEQTGGHLWTIEIDAGRAKQCRENLEAAGLDKVVTSIEGNAFKEIGKLEGPFDFVFIDAWKEDYDEFFTLVFPKLKEGGVILGHNAIRQKDQMQDYLDIVQNHPELDTVILSTTLDDGFAVSYRKKKDED